MQTEDYVLLTVALALVLVAACAITWAITDSGWETNAIASGHAERVEVDGSLEFAWK